MASLRSLDLFSGIGGLTLALKGLCEPLCFCEIDRAAQAVLQDQMRRGGLPAAPICSDVRTLTPQWLRGHTNSLPNSLVGGFPCTGFSLLGLGAGFDDEQSGLFMEICRLLDLFPIHFLFLENVPQFLNAGMTRAAAELHTKRGFELRWCCCEAREVGAPQLRRRFFCVGVKAGAALPKALKFTDGGYRPFAARWLKEPRRTVCAADASTAKSTARDARERASLLGNAVVPDCARHAVFFLWSGAQSLNKPAVSLSALAHKKKWPSHGLVTRGRVYATRAPAPPNLRPPVRVVLDGTRYKAPRGYKSKIVLQPQRARMTLDYWPTPRAQLTTASQVMSARTARDLPTRNAADTPDEQRGCPVSPLWIEWLMGYEQGWTAAAATGHVPP
jgi:hypothetical protein